MPSKRIYIFGRGRAEGRVLSKAELGVKGHALHEMAAAGLPVPTGFTLTVDTCTEYHNCGKNLPADFDSEMTQAMDTLEKIVGKKLGDLNDPLLVSVRSSAASSLPGMMAPILNLGLNDKTVDGLAKKTGSLHFAYDMYRRFIEAYSCTVMGLPQMPMEKMREDLKRVLGVKFNREIPVEALKELCVKLKEFYKQRDREFPQNPVEQLRGAIKAAFDAWTSEKSVLYRRIEKLTGLKGTAVNISQSVFGNTGSTSATGICFTRDPHTGVNIPFGDFLINATGEDILVGVRTPMAISELSNRLPLANSQLSEICRTLEQRYGSMQELEFTIEEGTVYLLQSREGRCSPLAAARIAVDMVREGLRTAPDALKRVDIGRTRAHLSQQTLQRWIDGSPAARQSLFANGIAAAPGMAQGFLAFNASDIELLLREGKPPILAVPDIGHESSEWAGSCCGILATVGGRASYAGIHARVLDLPCVIVHDLKIDVKSKELSCGSTKARTGAPLSLAGDLGRVYDGHFFPTPDELNAVIAADPLLRAATCACGQLEAWSTELERKFESECGHCT